MEVNRWRLYAAARNDDRKISGLIRNDFERMEVRSSSSASKLMEGGLAMFVIEAINHHRQGVGRRVKRPFVRRRLRVFVDS